MFGILKSVLTAVLDSEGNQTPQSKNKVVKKSGKSGNRNKRKKRQRRMYQTPQNAEIPSDVPIVETSAQVIPANEPLGRKKKAHKKLSTVQKVFIYSEIFGKPKGL